MRTIPHHADAVPLAIGDDCLGEQRNADPAETTDVTEGNPEIAAEMGRMMDDWLSEDTGETREYHVTPELRETLRSLGYVD